MIFVDNRDVTDARVNLALEEHVLRNRMGADDYLLFYINAPSIIIGRNQNTIEEVNPGVVSARESDYDVRLAAEYVNQFSFCFVAPLGADNDKCWHFSCSLAAEDCLPKRKKAGATLASRIRRLFRAVEPYLNPGHYTAGWGWCKGAGGRRG